jgi:hypothetical protein
MLFLFRHADASCGISGAAARPRNESDLSLIGSIVKDREKRRDDAATH